ncbi:MAG: prepilin peptidase [Patescibacteria group bacterium]
MEPFFVAGIFGACIGSFVNVLVMRMGKGESWITGRSHCTACKALIAWYDLVPVVSALLLGFRCRACHKRFSSEYFWGELGMAGLAVAWVFTLGPSIQPLHIAYALALILFVALLRLDARHFWLPDTLTASLAVVALAGHLLAGSRMQEYLLSGAGLAAFFGILHVVSRGRWIGLGDAKLAGGIGFLLGYPLGFLAVVGGVWLAAAWALVLVLLKRATLRTAIPLGTFLCIGAIIVILFPSYVRPLERLF